MVIENEETSIERKITEKDIIEYLLPINKEEKEIARRYMGYVFDFLGDTIDYDELDFQIDHDKDADDFREFMAYKYL